MTDRRAEREWRKALRDEEAQNEHGYHPAAAVWLWVGIALVYVGVGVILVNR